MIGITYHKDYDKYDLGLDNPLIGDKPKKTMEFFKTKNILKEIKTFIPEHAKYEDLIRAHDKKYVEKVKELSKTGGKLAGDTPAPKGIYEIASRSVGGSILGCKNLIGKYKIMCNPLGGFHHAGKDKSSGFCFFNDIAVSIEYLREKHNFKKFAVIDLDVHHGNGTQDIYIEDPNVLNISFHQDGRTLYPGTGRLKNIGKNKGKGYTVNLPLPRSTATASYLISFNQIVPPLIEQFEPEIIIYQSGVDTHYTDPLADLDLTYQAFYYLSEKIRKLSKKGCDNLLVLFGGGYNSHSSVISSYNIMCGLMNRKNFIKEEDSRSHFRIETVMERVSRLKKELKPYWEFE